MTHSLKSAVSRRQRLMEQHPDGLILVRASGPHGVNPNFRYLTGLVEPAAVLVLAASGLRVGGGKDSPGPDYFSGRSARQLLFLPHSDPIAARWGEDARVSLEGTAPEEVGVDALLPRTSLDGCLAGWLQRSSRLSLVGARPPALDGDGADPLIDTIRRSFLNVELQDVTGSVGAMRTVKDEFEIAAIERAAAITATGFARLLETLRPGVTEHALEAQLVAAYREAGAEHAFGPIVGAGAHALRLHYRENAGSVSDGDLVLIDSGATLDGYGADVTRTFPANGIFSARQRELYQVVLDAQAATIAAIRPGCRIGELHAVAWHAIEQHGHGAAFLHGIGHHLGLETHDAGDNELPLQPGAVITVEPGIYLPDEGIGIRIEDDLLVTAEGCRVLTQSIPREIDEIEALMQGSGS